MLDINAEMLEEGKKRFARTMYHDGEHLFSMFTILLFLNCQGHHV